MKYCCQTGGFYAGPMYQKGGYYGGPRFQRGGAIRGFAGPEYQMGGKWAFGSFLWRHAKPLLSFLGRRALETGVDIGQDVLDGKNLKQSARERLTETGKNIATTALDKVKSKIQSGRGKKRRRRTTKSSVKRKTGTKTARRRKRVRKAPATKRRAKSRKPAVKKKSRKRRRRRQPKTIFD